MIGKTLGHYQIIEKLGQGGMGVVYKARDLHLDREVVVKVLPPERVADPDRKRRFVQEARAASALNHANIIHIYDIDKAEGVDFIAMEYVVGKTLDQRIGHRGLRLNDALKYAVQIADALAKAHSAGIVHRDLKPTNIMVNEDGVVKVLDFGLAKLTEQIEGDESASTATIDAEGRPVTEEGVIVGTVAYMSPEQAQGKKVDARSDIFSFGSVLYELVTGRQAFQSDSKMSMLAAIVNQEPKPLTGVVPAELERIIQKCLRKDPKRRYQHIDDVRSVLEDLKEESDSGKLAAVPGKPARKGFRVAVIAGALILAAAASGVTWWLMRTPRQSAGPVLTRLTSDTGLTTDPALSSDGKLLAFASDRAGEGNFDIWVRQVGGGEPIRLTREPADEREPAFSPDGTKIAFRSERDGGGIYLVSTLGGPARKIASQGRRPQFSPDGEWVAYGVGWSSNGVLFSSRHNCRIYLVPVAGGAPRQLQPDFAGAAFPVWSPDGEHLLFLGNRDEKRPTEESVDWWVTPLDPGTAVKTGALAAARREKLSGPVQAIPWALFSPVWVADGNSLVFSARSGDSANLWRIGISPETWKVTGPPVRLTSGSTREEMPSAASAPGGTWRVAFASLSENIDIWSLPIDANQGKTMGPPQSWTQDMASDFHPSLSADGSRMVFISDRTGHQEIWLKDLRSGEESALTSTRANKYLPRFSPDGSRVSYTGIVSEKWNGFVMPAAGGAAEQICGDCGEVTDWTADGKHIIGNSIYGRVYLLEVASRRIVELLAYPERWFAVGHFSPDQLWVALLDGRSFRTYIAPFRGEARIEESDLIDIGRGCMMR